MYGVWKRLFIGATILLVTCAAFGGSFWYQLNVTKNQLANTEVQLGNTVVELDTTKTQLVDAEAQLDTTEAQLVDTEAQLDTTKTQLVDTEAQLDTTKNELTLAKSRLETAEDENSQMVSQYAGFRNQINARLGWTPQDKQSFITPSNSSVSAKAQEITGGYSENVNEYWRDFEQLYRWVVNNISYSYDSYMPVLPENILGELIWQNGCWRMPEETLEDETGDCEDMAVLLASMLRSYSEGKYRVWVLLIRSTFPEVTGHAAVAFPVAGGKLTILDPAANYYTGQYGSLRSESVSIAVNKWLSHWQSEMPDAEIIGVFSEDIFEEFSSTAEFITWAQE